MSGWQSVFWTIHGADKEKIDDAKDDIDTLLVFVRFFVSYRTYLDANTTAKAGLFSAVLSAFLVESYTALQPDVQSQMVTLLERIATQNYTFNAGSLNITSFPPNTDTFSAPPWAEIVNGLWFASLIVSLATASLGMLVKSWLREYLAVKWVTPQERLRVREYRRPALDTWAVFEIAAALPIMLQVALGLFFVGLCFFTAAVNKRMGHTSLPLVAAWAFFLLITTLAPLVSPRCPFKLPLLKGVMKIGRRYLMSPLIAIFTTLATGLAMLTKPGERTNVGSQYQKLEDEEEETYVARSTDDVPVLLSIDRTLGSDNLLETMWEALKQSKPNPSQAMSLIHGLIENRQPHAKFASPTIPQAPPSNPNLHLLSRIAYGSLFKISCEIFAMEDELLGMWHTRTLHGILI